MTIDFKYVYNLQEQVRVAQLQPLVLANYTFTARQLHCSFMRCCGRSSLALPIAQSASHGKSTTHQMQPKKRKLNVRFILLPVHHFGAPRTQRSLRLCIPVAGYNFVSALTKDVAQRQRTKPNCSSARKRNMSVPGRRMNRFLCGESPHAMEVCPST